MSYESTIEAPRGLIAILCRALFGSPHKPSHSKPALPWTAYSPANLRPKSVARETRNVVSKIGPPHTAGAAERQQSTAIATITETASVEVIQLREVSPPLKKPEVQPARYLPAPVRLKLIAKPTVTETVATLPGLAAATGRDFQLAARLRSVNTLNRIAAKAVAEPAIKQSGMNRPVVPANGQKRRRQIEPPAVQPRRQITAEVIQLRLAHARTGVQQAPARRVA